MKKREWFLILAPLFGVWIVDHLSKKWAMGLVDIKQFGILTLVLFHNPGAMLGLFSNLPAILRIVSLSTGGAFLVCTYGIIQYLLPIRSMKLRMGMSFLLGGILGNVTDRILWGYVVDFIIIGKGSFSTAVFNLADALQWVGYALIVIAIIKESHLLWPDFDTRKMKLINKGYQLKYSFFLVAVGMSLTLVGAVFYYTYFRVKIVELVGKNVEMENRFLLPFIFTYVVICSGFSAILFVLGRFLSHRSAGPIHALELYVTDLLAGKERDLKLRAGDDFRSLELLAEKIKPYLMAPKPPPTDEVTEHK
jgi:signal peptidase II